METMGFYARERIIQSLGGKQIQAYVTPNKPEGDYSILLCFISFVRVSLEDMIIGQFCEE